MNESKNTREGKTIHKTNFCQTQRDTYQKYYNLYMYICNKMTIENTLDPHLGVRVSGKVTYL